MIINIAIDGPAGAGKSTIAKRIAKEMGYIYVDTGAMYRAMALFLIRNRIEPQESDKISEVCKKADISIEYKDGEQVVLLNGENVNPFLRTEEVGNMASKSSVNKEVREKLVDLQKQLAKRNSVVMDGRDIGTCVLPQAQIKVFLTATSRVRAIRRFEELKQKGFEADLEKIEADIIERDQRDMTREISPLKQAKDAILLDSSDKTPDEVVAIIRELASKRL